MHRYTAVVSWKRRGESFRDGRYSRSHRWGFDGGTEVFASASPQIVREPMSDPAGVDPEEAFVAALSSCHMLWYLSIAADRGLVLDEYRDDAEGSMARNEEGRLAMTRVRLRPAVTYVGSPPSPEVEREMHEAAHEACYIANSVRTEVVIEPVAGVGTAVPVQESR